MAVCLQLTKVIKKWFKIIIKELKFDFFFVFAFVLIFIFLSKDVIINLSMKEQFLTVNKN